MNWDKPLPLMTLVNEPYSRTLEHHGYVKSQWMDFLNDCGLENGDNWESFYSKYLNYCKLMSSPLGKALQ